MDAIALRLYKALVLSVIDYGDVLYDGANKKELDNVQRLQNRALHIVSHCQRYTTNIALHRKYNVVPLFIRRKANQVKAMRNYLLHNPEKNRMLDQSVDRVTRLLLAPYLDLPHPYSSKFQKSCSYLGPQSWNSLPTDIRRENDPLLFKTKLKAFALAQSQLVTSVFEMSTE